MNSDEITYKAFMLFIAMAKAQNDEYTRFLGMFNHMDKKLFNELVRASEKFSHHVYEKLTAEEKETIDHIQDLLHNFVNKIATT
jgi:hypothetical protein